MLHVNVLILYEIIKQLSINVFIYMHLYERISLVMNILILWDLFKIFSGELLYLNVMINVESVLYLSCL